MLASCWKQHVARCSPHPPIVSHGRRAFSTTSRIPVQHLLWSGTLLDQSTTSFTPFDDNLFYAAGAAEDINEGVTLLPPSASPTRGHSLLPYRTRAGLSRIFAIGRNTSSQLGLGFSSQEATFGLIRPGFFGQGGVQAVVAGTSQTFILTSDKVSIATRLFACGNNTLGQLGMGDAPLRESMEPQMHILPAPQQVVLSPSHDSERQEAISSFGVGVDHAIVCLHSSDGLPSILTTGMNGDGQLGRSDEKLGYSSTFGKIVLPSSVKTDDVRVAAGADTCAAWTSYHLAVWGNAEYIESMIEGIQLAQPTDVSDAVRERLGGEAIQDVKIAGSAIFVLDASGRLFSCGFGPTGRSGDDWSLKQIEDLPPIGSFCVSLDGVIAKSQDSRRIFVWGLDANGGTLGVGSWDRESGNRRAVRPPPTSSSRRVNPSSKQDYSSSSSDSSSRSHTDDDQHPDQNWHGEDLLRRISRPIEVDLTLWLGREEGSSESRVEAICCGGEVSYLLLEDGQEPKGIWQPRSSMVTR